MSEPGNVPPHRTRARKPVGTARVHQPIKDRRTGLWRARYIDLEGVVRQLGRYERKGDALAHTTAFVTGLNQNGRDESAALPTLVAFLNEQ